MSEILQQNQLDLKMDFEVLPFELKIQIILNLSIPDILNLSQVSRTFLLICQSESLWNDLVQRYFGLTYKSEETWREVFHKLMRIRANEILISASTNGDLREVNYALFYDADNYGSSLLAAAKGGYIEIVRLILNLMGEYYITPCYFYAFLDASKGSHIDIFKLLDANQDIHDVNYSTNYHSALKGSILGGNVDMIKLVLEAMKEKHLIIDCNIPLLSAVQSGNKEIVLFILGEIETREINYDEIIRGAAAGRNLEVVKIILSRMTNLNITPKYKKLLKSAVEGGNIEIFELFLEKMLEQDINSKYSPSLILLEAIDCKNIKMVQFALEFIDDLNINLDYNMYLDTSIICGDSKTFELILSEFKRKGITPHYDELLFAATEDNAKEIVDIILNNMKKDYMIPDYDGTLETATDDDCWKVLFILIRYMRDNQVKFQDVKVLQKVAKIVAKKGDQNLLDDVLEIMKSYYLTPNYNRIISGATKGGHLEIILSLAKRGNISLDYQKLSNLAAENGNVKVFKYMFTHFLYSEEGDLGTMENFSITPLEGPIFYKLILEEAIKGGIVEIVKLILDNFRGRLDHNQILENAISSKGYQIVRFLLNQDSPSLNYERLVRKAVECGDVKMVKLILRLLDSRYLPNLSSYSSFYSEMNHFLRDQVNKS